MDNDVLHTFHIIAILCDKINKEADEIDCNRIAVSRGNIKKYVKEICDVCNGQFESGI